MSSSVERWGADLPDQILDVVAEFPPHRFQTQCVLNGIDVLTFHVLDIRKAIGSFLVRIDDDAISRFPTCKEIA